MAVSYIVTFHSLSRERLHYSGRYDMSNLRENAVIM
jgi:hypothetical protein